MMTPGFSPFATATPAQSFAPATASPTNRTVNFPAPAAPTSPLYRKEHLDLREALERENKTLQDQLKRCKTDYKILSEQKDALLGEYRAYKAKKETLCAKYRGDIAVLTDQLNSLTDGQHKPRYTNNKPLSGTKPFVQTPNTHTYLDSSSPRRREKIDARGNEVREKLATVTAANNQAPFAQPTFTEVMRRITPTHKAFDSSLRAPPTAIAGALGSKKATGTSGNGGGSSSSSSSNQYNSSSVGSSNGQAASRQPFSGRAASFSHFDTQQPSPHHDGSGFGQAHSQRDGSISFSMSGSRGGFVFSDRRPGEEEDEGDVPLVMIDLSTR